MNYKNVERLRTWREKRNINEANTQEYVGNCIEELFEIFYDDKDLIDFLKQEVMDKYFKGLGEISEERTIDSFCDIQVFSINECELRGYDSNKSLLETIKEISSREQDPEQKARWEKEKVNEKWKKDKKQKKSTLYSAKYDRCKLIGEEHE